MGPTLIRGQKMIYSQSIPHSTSIESSGLVDHGNTIFEKFRPLWRHKGPENIIFFTFWAKFRIKSTLASSFLKIEQNKYRHRVPRKKIHNPGGFKISSISYIAAVMSENVFLKNINVFCPKYIFGHYSSYLKGIKIRAQYISRGTIFRALNFRAPKLSIFAHNIFRAPKC